MTFGDFARNYLNPIFLALRLGLFSGGGACLMIAFASDANVFSQIFFGILGLWLFWVGIKPWGNGKGLSANQLNS